MRKKYVVRLSDHERELLFELINQGKGGKERLNRARILLKADIGEQGEKWIDADIAKAFYVGVKTVERTRKSLVEEGLEATINRQVPKIKRKRIIDGDQEAHLIALACSNPPEGYCAWTLRLLADTMVEMKYVDSVCYETIRQALKKTNLSLGKKKNGVFLQKAMRPSSVKWKKSSISTKCHTTQCDPSYAWMNQASS
jgi:transposase